MRTIPAAPSDPYVLTEATINLKKWHESLTIVPYRSRQSPFAFDCGWREVHDLGCFFHRQSGKIT
jgi:hypothetical protein